MKKCSTFGDKKVTMSKIVVDTSVYKAAMAYIQTISATGGKPVPADGASGLLFVLCVLVRLCF